MIKHLWGRGRRGKAWIALFALLVSFTASTLYAQTNKECSDIGGNWCLRFSEMEDRLVHSTDPKMADMLAVDIGINRNNILRNAPMLELSNRNAAGGADIVKFEMTIGDTRFHFEDGMLGTAALLGINTPDYADYLLTPTISPDGNKLTVNISKAGGGGLPATNSLYMQIDLGLDDGFSGKPFYQNPDFRTVLFDMNGVQEYGPDPAIPAGAEDNSQIRIFFSNGAVSGPKALRDYAVTGPQADFKNANFHGLYEDDPVDLFAMSGVAGVIPEPGAAILAIMGVIACSLLGGRTRHFTRR
jgi:hypothetical protein